MAESFLEPFLAPVKNQKLIRFRAYIQKRPRFRPLLNLRFDWLNEIRADVSDDELDIELYKLMHRLEIEVRKEGIQLRDQRTSPNGLTLHDHKRKFEKFLTESNQVGQAKLAEYIIHRRGVIDFLSDCLKLSKDGKYELEEVVHDIIFPMRNSSDSIRDPDHSNLWMIDERLAYHYYLASDLEFRQNTEIKVKQEFERERTDLLVLQPYDRPHAFVNTSKLPYDAVTIIEFKRPMRDDYAVGEPHRDPIKQVWEYAAKIQAGHGKDKNGREIKINPGTQYYAFIVSSLTEKLEALAELYGLKKTPDNLGYFGYHPNFFVYTEIIDFEKLIEDAKKRNEVFFDKFNLPPMS